jgi:SAM-dependent methyltransferase
MDILKFYDITHREQVICNPTSEEKLARLVALLRLPADARVVDIACGKGEFLIRLAEAYGVRGMGIDISPFHIAEAKRRLEAHAPGAGIAFIQMNGADYKPDEPRSLDLASCIGAGWVFGGHAKTLEALIGMVRPGGWVIAGEPYWRKEPSGEYLEALGCGREDFGSHFSNAEAGELLGMELVHTIVSGENDWDGYEGLQWFTADEFARTHPDDPDLAELAERVSKAKAAYLRWGRDTLGWAIYVFRVCASRLSSGVSMD